MVLGRLLGLVTYELADASSCEAAVGAELALTCQLDAGFRLILPDLHTLLATRGDFSKAVRRHLHQCRRPSC